MDEKNKLERIAKLNRLERLQWLDPELIWRKLDISNPSSLADIGAGSGIITERLAKYAPQALLLALEVDPYMVEYMNNNYSPLFEARSIHMGILPLEDDQLDACWAIDVYHELKDPEELLVEVQRVLQPGGKFLIIDWKIEEFEPDIGPGNNERIDSRLVESQLRKNGFEDIQIDEDFIGHFAITAIST